MLVYKLVEQGPGNELQETVKDCILMPHGAGFFPSLIRRETLQAPEESSPCARSRKIEPDSRGLLSRPPSARTSVRAKDSLHLADARRLGGRLKRPAMTDMEDQNPKISFDMMLR
jgi:hypothetical protein